MRGSKRDRRDRTRTGLSRLSVYKGGYGLLHVHLIGLLCAIGEGDTDEVEALLLEVLALAGGVEVLHAGHLGIAGIGDGMFWIFPNLLRNILIINTNYHL